jgi:hypothetical protein
MGSKDPRRALIALATAYAIALQAMLLAVGVPAGGPQGFAAAPLCVTLGAGHSAPSGDKRDCLDACLTGCCGTGPSIPPAPVLAAAYILAPSVVSASAIETAPFSVSRSTRAHGSRAPPATTLLG